MTIDLTRRYAAGERLPTGPEWFELQRLVAKHRTATPSDAAYTAEAVNAALEAEQVEQRLQAAQPGDTFTLAEINAGARQLAATVAEVRASRILAETTRRDALHAAALVYQGRAHDVGTETILLAADDFAAWLRDEPLPDPHAGEGEAWLPTGDPAPPRLRPVEQPVYDPPLVQGVKVLGYSLAELGELTDRGEIDRLAELITGAVDRGEDTLTTRGLLITALAILRRQR